MSKRSPLRSLSLHLRHNPEGLPLDRRGAIPLGKMARYLSVSVNELVEYAQADAKGRYVLYADGCIGASQGHSFPVSSEIFAETLRSAEDYRRVLGDVPMFHGTSYSAWVEIMNDGFLRPMSREHVHLDTTPGRVEAALRRHGHQGQSSTVVLEFSDIDQLFKDVSLLYVSENGVILSPEPVPVHSAIVHYVSDVESLFIS